VAVGVSSFEALVQHCLHLGETEAGSPMKEGGRKGGREGGREGGRGE